MVSVDSLPIKGTMKSNVQTDSTTQVMLLLFAAQLHDCYSLAVVNGTNTDVDLKRDLEEVKHRVAHEGKSFLTKALPRLGKAFDKALTGDKFNAEGLEVLTSVSQETTCSQVPKLFGSLFKLVINDGGDLLPNPCPTAVKCIRQLLYSFYKYELPYTQAQSEEVIKGFIDCETTLGDNVSFTDAITSRIVIAARRVLERLFCNFDPTDIQPRHGPGAVAEKLTQPEKWNWEYIPDKLIRCYGLEYFLAGKHHMSDALKAITSLPDGDPCARVILVPKDSRGPRLISSEPVVFQYIQQGLMSRIVDLVESHTLTKGHVNFTDQTINRNLALASSRSCEHATLDLKEASDRVSLDLVRRIFPEWLTPYFESCRSEHTELPNGSRLKLRKFAPMGSALCFPVLALTIFSVLVGAGIDPKGLFVYGDDVIVPLKDVSLAIDTLERVGLKVNKDKSCLAGLFRESCGMDAFNGVCVTPLRFRTVWDHRPNASVYASFCEYQNSFFEHGFAVTAQVLHDLIRRVYPMVPVMDGGAIYPHLRVYRCDLRKLGHNPRKRYNQSLQRLEVRVLVPNVPTFRVSCDGWWKVLRYFTSVTPRAVDEHASRRQLQVQPEFQVPFNASVYARNSATLVWKWLRA